MSGNTNFLVGGRSLIFLLVSVRFLRSFLVFRAVFLVFRWFLFWGVLGFRSQFFGFSEGFGFLVLRFLVSRPLLVFSFWFFVLFWFSGCCRSSFVLVLLFFCSPDVAGVHLFLVFRVLQVLRCTLCFFWICKLFRSFSWDSGEVGGWLSGAGVRSALSLLRFPAHEGL